MSGLIYFSIGCTLTALIHNVVGGNPIGSAVGAWISVGIAWVLLKTNTV